MESLITSEDHSLTVGITDCARYQNYERWFLDAPESIHVIRLSYHLNNISDIEQCHGVVLSGGEDVDPTRYKRADLRDRLELTDIDERRDEFEWAVIDEALKLKLPILGICRGMQLFNIYQGGTLIFDIPEVTKIIGHARFQGMDQRHDIHVVDQSLLNRITGCLRGAVNSSHHQCIDEVAPSLRVSARAEDPIVEAMEWSDCQREPFYLGVQWHPERMVDQQNPFSLNIRQTFIQSAMARYNRF